MLITVNCDGSEILGCPEFKAFCDRLHVPDMDVTDFSVSIKPGQRPLVKVSGKKKTEKIEAEHAITTDTENHCDLGGRSD